MPRHAPDTSSVDAAHDFRRPLGQLLVEEGILTTEQLDAALRAQYGTDKQLGQVLVELGYVASGVVEAALVEQQAPVGPFPSPAPLPEPQPESEPDVLEAWREAVDQRDALIGRYGEELAARDARIVALGAQVAELRDRPAAEPEPEPEPEPAETAHVRFVPAVDGYRLAEADGPAPAPGERVEHDGRLYVVERLGLSPLPGSRLRCAYLAAAPVNTISP